MNAARLLALYERVAEAPNAIVRLRRFVLDLAVRGKLVEQDARDEPASGQLAQARRNLKERARDAKRIRWKETESVEQEFCDLPSGWVVARVNDTGLFINGLAFKPTDWKPSGLPIIRIQNLTDPRKEFNYAQGDFPDEVLVREGDLLVSWSATLDAFKWSRGNGVLNQHIFRVLPEECLTVRDFLLLVLRNAIREMGVGDHARGLVMTHINRGPFLNHIVRIPPLAEQHRIVAKVDELMALLDRLEAARSACEATRDRLTTATLARLTAPDTDAQTLPTHARFALDTLPALTNRADQIKQLRQTILNLAVRGKLVAQISSEESGRDLLAKIQSRRIAIAKAAGVRLKTIKKFQSDPTVHNFPGSWAVESFGSLVDPTRTISYGVLVPGQDVEGGVPLVRAQDLAISGQPARPSKSIAPEVEAPFARTRLMGGEILLCVVGSIGKIGVAPEAWAGANIARAVARIAPSDGLDRDYLLVAMRSDLMQAAFADATRTLAQPTLNVGLIEALQIPIPPLAEQHRIVAKVDELMTLCDSLEAALQAADRTRARLLEALLHEALASDSTERKAA